MRINPKINSVIRQKTHMKAFKRLPYGFRGNRNK